VEGVNGISDGRVATIDMDVLIAFGKDVGLDIS